MRKRARNVARKRQRILGRVLAQDLSKVAAGLTRCVETDAPEGQFPDDEIVTDPTTWLKDGG